MNILAPVIQRLFAAGLPDLVAAGGRLLLGGIMHEQAGAVMETAGACGLTLVKRSDMGDWVALACDVPV